MGPQNLPEQLRSVRNRIESATHACGRNVDSVTLLAASKAQSANTLRLAAQLGVRHFGESYVQEAAEKMEVLRDLPVTWHFIGRLQANKTRPVASSFDWVHGVDRLKIAQRLSEQRPFHAPPLNVCLEVNIAGESSKGGITTTELPALAAAVASLPRLKLRGLMCIPPDEADPSRQRAWFAGMRQQLEALNAAGADLDTLSMGMSADLESAILEGATIVRVGTALFGPRLTGSQAGR
jgi:pyridoxal phosphate enzyme (YggS family)